MEAMNASTIGLEHITGNEVRLVVVANFFYKITSNNTFCNTTIQLFYALRVQKQFFDWICGTNVKWNKTQYIT